MLNFGTSCFSASVAWSSIAADYNTYFPEDTNQLTIYLLTYVGNAVGIVTVELLGAAVYTGTYQIRIGLMLTKETMLVDY